MENIESASFILRTCDIINIANASVNSSNGSVNDAYRASYTWYNINIRQILGTLWDKYDFFELNLMSVVMGTLEASSVTSHDRFHSVYMRGLEWVGCNYVYSVKHENNRACIACLSMQNLTTATPIVDVGPANITNCFSKGNPSTDISIDLFSILSNILNVPANAGTGALYPQMVFTFNIKPIKKEELSVQLYLKRFQDATVNVANGSSLTWKGLDLRSVLGQLWYEYDYFNITLVTAQSSAFSGTFIGDVTTGLISLSGLPFVNPATTTAIMGPVDFGAVASAIPAITETLDFSQISFSKDFPIVDLTIKFIKMTSNDLITPTTGNIANYVFLFKITGVEKFDK